MNPHLLLTLGILAICIGCFIANRPRMDVVAILPMLALPLCGVITLPEAFAGFSDPNVILIAALFVVGESLVRTGIANQIGAFLSKKAAGSETRLLILIMLAVAGLGSLMSSTGVVAIFIPITLRIAANMRISPGRLMMPLSFAGLISGMITLVGTAPNLVVDSALRHAGIPGFGFFSFTPYGLAVLAAGIGYMIVARRWLNAAEVKPRSGNARRRLRDFIHAYALAGRDFRVRVLHGSPLANKTLQELQTRERYGANIVAVDRHTGHGRELIDARADTVILSGDILFADVPDPKEDNPTDLLASLKLEPLPLQGGYFSDRTAEIGMAEVLLPPESAMVGHAVLELAFRTKHRLNVIGLRRGSKALPGGVLEEKLRPGDALLVAGPWKAIRQLQKQMRDFLVLSLPAEIDQVVPALSQAPYALISLALMVTLMVTGWTPNSVAALIACLLMGACRCITIESAYKAIQWPSLILIVGMMPFSAALQKTGGVDLAVNGLLQLFGSSTPQLLLAALFALTAATGMFISNTATAVLMAPIAMTIAHQLHVSPYPFAMTVALGASAAFMTPISSPVNTLVLEPGRYRFSDFVKVGVPFTVLVLLIAVILVPWLLPLRP